MVVACGIHVAHALDHRVALLDDFLEPPFQVILFHFNSVWFFLTHIKYDAINPE